MEQITICSFTNTKKEERAKKDKFNHKQLSSIASWNLLSYVEGSPNSQRLNLERSELSDEFLAGRRHLTSGGDDSRCGCRLLLFLVIC